MESEYEFVATSLFNLYATIERLQPQATISKTLLQASCSTMRKTVLQRSTQGFSRLTPTQLPSQEAPTPGTLLAIVVPMFAGKTTRLMHYAE